jgi:hypothetical protein
MANGARRKGMRMGEATIGDRMRNVALCSVLQIPSWFSGAEVPFPLFLI